MHKDNCNIKGLFRLCAAVLCVLVFAGCSVFGKPQKKPQVPKQEIEKSVKKEMKTPETRHITGTGLGLSIVKKIIEGHRGLMSIESTEGRGTRVRIQLSKT